MHKYQEHAIKVADPTETQEDEGIISIRKVDTNLWQLLLAPIPHHLPI